jgi:hypothetical protein
VAFFFLNQKQEGHLVSDLAHEAMSGKVSQFVPETNSASPSALPGHGLQTGKEDGPSSNSGQLRTFVNSAFTALFHFP